MSKPNKSAKPRVFNPQLEIGGEAVLQCEDCNSVNFKVQLEPDYTDPEMAKQLGSGPRRVMFCPFCGNEDLTEV